MNLLYYKMLSTLYSSVGSIAICIEVDIILPYVTGEQCMYRSIIVLIQQVRYRKEG